MARAYILKILGLLLWPTPVIPGLWKSRWGDRVSSRVQDLPGQHGDTMSVQKIQKFSRCDGAPVVQATEEAEVGESPEPRKSRLQ